MATATTTTVAGLHALLQQLGVDVPVPPFEGADVMTRPIDIWQSYLAELLSGLLESEPAKVYESVQRVPVSMTELGDLDIVIPRLKISGVQPTEVAMDIMTRFPRNPSHPLFTLPFPDNVHLRLFFSIKTLPPIIFRFIIDRKDDYGRDASLGLRADAKSGRKKVVVDFGSPNIGHESSTTHMRSAIIGSFISNMYEAMGWEVIRHNYLGDWGPNFALLAVGIQRFGSLEELVGHPRPLACLSKIYAQIEEAFQPERDNLKRLKDENHDEFLTAQNQGLCGERDFMAKMMEEGVSDAVKLWKDIREVTIEEYKKTYARLGINFDEYGGESQVCLEPKLMSEVEDLLKGAGTTEEEDGSWVIDFEKERLHKPTLRNRNGLSSYLLRDIATAVHRDRTHKPDKVVYVVATDQDTHFRQLFKALDMMGCTDIREKLEHVGFGRAMPGHETGFEDAKQLDDILDQSEMLIRNITEIDPESYHIDDGEVPPELMGAAALTAQDLAVKKTKGYTFSPNHMVFPEGEAGPAVLLCYAKLCRTISSLGSIPSPDDISGLDHTPLFDEPWANVVRLLPRYPDMTIAAYRAMEAGTTILPFLFRLAEEVMGCLDEIGEEEVGGGSSSAPDYRSRVTVLECARQVMENAMRILGMTPSA